MVGKRESEDNQTPTFASMDGGRPFRKRRPWSESGYFHKTLDGQIPTQVLEEAVKTEDELAGLNRVPAHCGRLAGEFHCGLRMAFGFPFIMGESQRGPYLVHAY